MQIFLSYNNTDAKLAGELSKGLSKLGYDVWFADRDLLPGDNWSLGIGRALESSDAMVVLVSPESAKSPTQSREVQYALGSPKYRGKVVSVLLGQASRIPTGSLPWILNRLAVIESGKTISETSKKIAAALRPVPKSARRFRNQSTSSQRPLAKTGTR
jgi:hypothetical protein